MREIKFRAWLKEKHRMINVNDINLKEKDVNEGFFSFYEIELMQYTGIKDKNGVEIYEGDIIQRKDYKFKIIWDETRFIGIGVSPMTGENLLCYIDSFDKFGKNYVEVIGNIYENLELGDGK